MERGCYRKRPKTGRQCGRSGRNLPARSGSVLTGSLPRDTDSSICGGNDGAGNCRKNGAEARIGAGEFVPRHADLAREIGGKVVGTRHKDAVAGFSEAMK